MTYCYILIVYNLFNTFQLNFKNVNDFGLSVCLYDNSRKYSFIAKKLTHVNMFHPSMFPIENGICSCYTFSTGPYKRNPIHYGQWAILIGSEF